MAFISLGKCKCDFKKCTKKQTEIINGKTITCMSIHNKRVLFPNTYNLIFYYFTKVEFTIFIHNLVYTSDDISTHTRKRTHPHTEKYIPAFY